jgi:murein DD-endopeptidase MepM/ murein hydrolase activator NlpD
VTLADAISAYVVLNVAVSVAVVALIAIESLASHMRSRTLLSLHYTTAALIVVSVLGCSLLPDAAIFRLWSPDEFQDFSKDAEHAGALHSLSMGNVSLDAGSVSRVWIAAALALLALGSLRLARDLRALRALRHESHCVRRHGRVRLWFSDRVTVPLSYWLPGRAHVVVPTGLIEQPRVVRMVVAHELQHHRQRDTSWLYFFRALTWTCWLNPFAHLWNQRLERMQEFSCDEALATRRAWSVADYARCLLDIAAHESRGAARHPLATHFIRFGDPNVLTRRIEKMFQQDQRSPARALRITVTCTLAAIVGASSYAATGATQTDTASAAASQSARAWPVENGHVAATFGGKHGGIDIAAAAGTEVRAFAAGRVVGRDVTKHCGAHVRIRHEDEITTLYCNLTDISVQPGDRVNTGSRVGAIAVPATGVSPHVHFELKVGDKKVDPLKHLPRTTA